MKQLFVVFLMIGVFTVAAYSNFPYRRQLMVTQPGHTITEKKAAKIQVTLLLDTSNSMDGLIDQAKSQLWKMVNELASSEKGGMTPDIEIALFEYGNSGLKGETGYIRQVSPLTTDLDMISEKLFALTTNGGDEYCGWVIKDAVETLKWSKSDDDLKLIIIAGNEPFTQGKVDYTKSCKEAITNGIMVNTIYCGDYNEGVATKWKDGADLTDGKYLNINQNDKVVHISTPYDDKIMELNQRLNKTYIGFGEKGKKRMSLQSAQDTNASAYGAANARTRALFKSKKQYNNAEWDMVDAVAEDEEVLSEVKDEALPEEMQGMTPEERKAYIAKKASERKEIQKELAHYEVLVKKYIAKKQKEDTESLTLDNVMMKAIRAQAASKKFVFH